ncbi:MAG: MFS transporter [Candidatus Liptonbacteria bacterium RIFCSPLOWO2_01_FULL_52_25]|uniref:MFS transporter n=1 Tax=Candidatus Liptonbacteria bacterium RIFCSPLOWO2_01_FULL_52_25 TaxID=1798650 RepID=A0A1G2CD93_9BACT|nr:MAG: MFS transporter [Candidatus Liptonbacteria bacterium RIFCSPLOWO2_01_FULL_52_25]
MLATGALAVNFWAWSLLGPLASRYAADLSLTPLKLSVLLAVPIVIGSLGRIPIGVLTDRYGGRRVFSLLSFFAALPVVWLALADTYTTLIAAAVLLGTAGTSFAVGVPFVAAWYPPERRGFALGVYGMGNIGTAISGFLTPRLAEVFDRQVAYFVAALALCVFGTAMALLGRNAPNWRPAEGSAWSRLSLAVYDRTTWDLSLVYAVTFGAFVAFGVYLPALLKVSYGLTMTDAATRAAGFVLFATIARPLGGFLSDKIGGQTVVRVALIATVCLAAVVAFQPTLALPTTVAYLSLAVALGCGNGAVVALVGRLSKPERVGSITGVVGASGGLGGFFPPLVLGFTYQATRSYSLALLMLAATAALVFIYIHLRFRAMKTADVG